MPFLNAAGHSLHYERIEGEAGKPPLVFLHEGLGSIRQWRDFPAKLCAATGCTGFIYDRYGYGQSDVLAEPRRTVRFMHDEALVALPRLVSEWGLSKPVLVGHSDSYEPTPDDLRTHLAAQPIMSGDTVSVAPKESHFDARVNVLGLTVAEVVGESTECGALLARVVETVPTGVVQVTDQTEIELETGGTPPAEPQAAAP